MSGWIRLELLAASALLAGCGSRLPQETAPELFRRFEAHWRSTPSHSLEIAGSVVKRVGDKRGGFSYHGSWKVKPGGEVALDWNRSAPEGDLPPDDVGWSGHWSVGGDMRFGEHDAGDHTQVLARSGFLGLAWNDTKTSPMQAGIQAVAIPEIDEFEFADAPGGVPTLRTVRYRLRFVADSPAALTVELLLDAKSLVPLRRTGRFESAEATVTIEEAYSGVSHGAPSDSTSAGADPK